MLGISATGIQPRQTFAAVLLERPFSLKIPAKAAHQVGTECPTFRFLHVRIGKMPTNFPEAFFRLLIPLQPLVSSLAPYRTLQMSARCTRKSESV
mgnify:CR=1 FL=1